MIAVSSFRPLDENPEFKANQIAAKRSWSSVFSRMIFLNQCDERMVNEELQTEFYGSDDFPCIKHMVEVCSIQEGWSCLINADIVVSDRIKKVEQELDRLGCCGAMSRRYNFEPRRGPDTGNVNDLGLDFFAAKQWVWKKCHEVIPDQFRIGHCFWDTWMMGFLNGTCRNKCADITPSRCIFHPIHGGRRTKYTIDTKFESPYFKYLGMPRLKITVANR